MNPTRHIWRIGLIVLFTSVICPAALAQESDLTIAQYLHTAWTEKDGAPKNIQAITQATDGFLWLGSVDGLFRFDGVAFEHYQPQTGAAFPAGGARALLALPNGDLWIGFYSGAVTLLRNGRAQNYTKRD